MGASVLTRFPEKKPGGRYTDAVLIAEPHYGGMTMDRDLLFLRLSIVWMAILVGGCAYIFFMK